jgi:hypothetical protein
MKNVDATVNRLAAFLGRFPSFWNNVLDLTYLVVSFGRNLSTFVCGPTAFVNRRFCQPVGRLTVSHVP